jgi:hypothetical protein
MYCLKCKTTEGILNVNMKYTRKDGTIVYYYMCNPCNKIRQKKYRQTPSGKQATFKAAKRYNEANRERQKAWQICKELGSKPCEVCGVIKTDKHHPDITKPLKVIWLCRLHHKARHRLESIV